MPTASGCSHDWKTDILPPDNPKLPKMPHSLRPYNTFGIEADCKELICYHSIDECLTAARHLQSSGLPWLPIGEGSNILFVNPHYPGTVVHNSITGIYPEEEGLEITLRVGGGEIWDDLVDYCTGRGWYGLENLSLIPGTVAASAVQNIGAYGAEAADCIVKVEGVYIPNDYAEAPHEATLLRNECRYGYRSSIFKDELKDIFLVTYVWFRLKKHFVPTLSHAAIARQLVNEGIEPAKASAKDIRNAVIQIRQQKLPDPKITGNAGSFFMNPVVDTTLASRLLTEYPDMPHFNAQTADGRKGVKIPAAWLIEQCGWKGRCLGRAGVNPLQPLVLTNLGGATGKDIATLAETIQHAVHERFGITLHPEVRFV